MLERLNFERGELRDGGSLKTGFRGRTIWMYFRGLEKPYFRCKSKIENPLENFFSHWGLGKVQSTNFETRNNAATGSTIISLT